MAEQQALNATFFTLKRRDRVVLLPATLVFLVIAALIVGAFVALNWNTLAQFVSLIRTAGAEQMSDEQAADFVFGFFGFFGSVFLFLFPLYIAIAAYEAACLRWMIRGEAPGLFGLTLDHDTWRVWGVYWCWFAAHLAISTALSIIMVPIMFMTMGDLIANPNPDPAAMMRWQISVQLPLTLLQYAVMIFVGVRFSPAAATSIARRRFSFFEAWAVTRERFWPLFGSFALLLLLATVAWVVLAAVTYGPLLMSIWGEVGQSWPSMNDEQALAIFERIWSPQTLIFVAIGYAGGLVVWIAYALMSYGVNARAAMVALEEGKIEVYRE